MYNYFKMEFYSLGFKTFEAFKNICISIDQTLKDADLLWVWEFGIANDDIDSKVNNVLENLRHE